MQGRYWAGRCMRHAGRRAGPCTVERRIVHVGNEPSKTMPRQRASLTLCSWLLGWVLLVAPQVLRAQVPNAESLVAAVRAGDGQRVLSALKRGADPDAIDARSWTALIHAA